ncbi:MAG: arsenate reductase [Flavobacteriales bacterium]|jgi:arsenate reductase
MKNKIFLLSSCSTCVRISKELGITPDNFDIQDIKQNPVSEDTIDAVAKQEGSYEAMFSKRAMKYKAMGLKEMNLTEKDLKEHMLAEYTFLKRPIIQVGSEYYVGNAKKTIEAVKLALSK